MFCKGNLHGAAISAGCAKVPQALEELCFSLKEGFGSVYYPLVGYRYYLCDALYLAVSENSF